MIAPVLLDVESRSLADLPTVGGRRYWEHPSSEALVVVWYDTATGDVGAWAPGMAWPHVGRVLAAHNAHGFDRHAAARYEFHPGGWIDTSQLARKAGLPGALDALGVRWCGTPKDKIASAYTKALSRPKRPAKDAPGYVTARAWAVLSPEERFAVAGWPAPDMARVTAYCASDVQIMADAWPRLAPWLGFDADAEAVDAAVNDRGIAFDAALARRLLAEDARLVAEALATCAEALGMTAGDCAVVARSPAQICARAGTPDAQATTVDAILAAPPDPEFPAAIPLARARRALASIAAGKLTAGLARVHADGRLRDVHRYYGAHTGRWSGSGMQLQNLPRPAKRFFGADPASCGFPTRRTAGGDDVDVDALADEVRAGRACAADEVALLVRATIWAPPGRVLVVRDFASVEARATAWSACDEAALEIFRSGLDPYKVAATAIFGVEYDDVSKAQRQVGKVAELALGYQGGPGALARMAQAYRIDLGGLDTRAIVDSWRALHSPIRDLWCSTERAFRSACAGRSTQAGPCEYVPSDDGDAVACFLPSGRPVVYDAARATDDGLTYMGTRGEEHVYGGKLVENAVQALCRDLMASALVRCEREGLEPVLHVHDEIVCECDEADAARVEASLHAIMLAAPAWAAGLPVDCDGWTGRRYRK